MKFNYENLDDQIGEIKIGSIIQMRNDRKKRGEVISKNGNDIIVKDCYGQNYQCKLEEIELSEQPIFKIGDLVKDIRSNASGKITAISPDRKEVTMLDNGFERIVPIWKLVLVSDILFDSLADQGAELAEDAERDFRGIKADVKRKKEKAAA